MNWQRQLHLSFKSAALTIGLHVDTCGCIAGEVLHRMGNQTRNRLESFHGKVKAYLNMTLWNCIDELLHFDRRKEIQTSHKVIVFSVKTRYRCGDDLAITDAIQSIAGLLAADIILQALKEAWKIEATIANKDTSSHFTVTVGDVSYKVVTLESSSCECTCFVSQLLRAVKPWHVFCRKEHLFRCQGFQRDGRGSIITTGPLYQVRWSTSKLWRTAPRLLVARNSVKWTEFFGTLPTCLPIWGTKTVVLDFTLL